MEVFVEVVGWVEEDEVEECVGDEVEAFEQVAVDEHIVAESRTQVAHRADERFQRGDLPGGDRQRAVARGPSSTLRLRLVRFAPHCAALVWGY